MKSRFRIPKSGWRYINVTFVAATAWVLAGVFGDLIGRSLGGALVPPVAPPHVRSAPDVSDPDYSLILRWNIFNHSARNAGESDGYTAPSLSSDQRGGAPKSAIAATLRGTVVDSDSRYSRATVTLTESKKDVVVKERDDLLGTTIVGIARNRLYLSRNGKTEVLEVPFGQLSSTTAGARGRGGIVSGADVTKAGEGEYLVSRRYIDAQLANMNRLITEVRAVPNIGKDGVTDGFRLFSIKKGSLFDKVGFNNRDVVKRINGITIDSAEKGLELFSALRSETNFEVDIERNKAKQSLRFSIQ